MSSLEICLDEEIIAIDGKTLPGSRSDSKRPLHLVGAWAVKNNLLLGQVKTAEKSNEIEAIPRLLNMLDIKGCTVTIDPAFRSKLTNKTPNMVSPGNLV